MKTIIELDYETYSEAQLVGPASVGVWNYSRDVSTEVLMVAYRIDFGQMQQVDLTCDRVPAEFVEAMEDPDVEKWAFNAAFERLMTLHLLGINTPYRGWRCTMALANLQSFAGDLGQIGRAMGVAQDKVKDKEGSRLIQLFSVPQQITRKNSLWRRDRHTDPDDWQKFLDYNRQDVIAESEIRQKLLRFPIPDIEWEMYEIDQQINDNGMPVKRRYVEQADIMANLRKRELKKIMQDLTGLANPNSSDQFLPWVKQRGYPFNDLQKNTLKKVLTENKVAEDGGEPFLADDCVTALKLRQQASRTSVTKYPAILRRLSVDDRLRHCFQFAGAARTGRWAGRGPQPHNLVRTPGKFEAEDGTPIKLEVISEIIVGGDYEALGLMVEEPMEALAGCIRGSFQAPDGQVLVVCDLSAIESAVIAWVTQCVRLLRVFRDKLDPYKDFGTELYHKLYDAITKLERSICKPAVLGCGYQLGGGDLRDGKRTGLWGYAESMGVDLTREEAAHHVKVFRELYHEIPRAWKELEAAVQVVLRGVTKHVLNGLVEMKMTGPYLTMRLPSGRHLFYYKPKIVERVFEGRDGPYTRKVFSYMGLNQVTRQWGRVYSSGGKIIENIVQAIARDILCIGLYRAHQFGFPIVGSVHDEIITCTREGENWFTLENLRECMIAPIEWAAGLPLGAAGYTGKLYRKD